MLKLPGFICIYHYQYVKLLLTDGNPGVLFFKKSPLLKFAFLIKLNVFRFWFFCLTKQRSSTKSITIIQLYLLQHQ
jgi:hypothetical protein